MSGAIDFNECPRGGGDRCRCEKCAKCHARKHTSVHGPLINQPPGSKPWDHEFVREKREQEAIANKEPRVVKRPASAPVIKVAGAIEVIVYNPKGRVVYTQYISPKMIPLRKLIDKLEDFFIDLSMEGV